jgi:hypothetical protein
MATTATRKMSNNDDSDDLTRKMFLSSISSTAIVSTAFSSVAAAAAGENIQSSIMARMEQCDDVTVDDGVVLRHRRPRARVLTISLRSLPKSGCWSAPIQISRTLDSDNNEQYFTYLAVVDSGSPFLTAPNNSFRQTSTIMMTKKKKKSSWSAAFRDEKNNDNVDENDNDNNQISYEQYGTIIGTVQWRMAPWVTLIGNGDKNINVQDAMNYYGDSIDRSENIDIEPIIIEDQNNVILGIPSDIVQEESGGIFIGLMAVDENRPTFMKQFGYDAFSLRFQNGNNSEERYDRVDNDGKNRDPASLVLWNGTQSDSSDACNTNEMIDRFDPSSMKLFDLTPYGPDLHHYGVLCNNFVCRWDEKGENNSVEAIEFDCCMGDDHKNSGTSASSYHLSLSRLSRPLIAVFDTGLSGCIFSDSLLEEIQVERQRRRQRQNRSSNKTRRQQRRDGPKDDDDKIMVDNDDNDDEPISCTVWLPTIGSSRTTSTNKDLDVSSSQSPSDPCIVKLSSVSNYWRFQSFRLPWWYDNNDGVRSENDGLNNNDNNSRNNYPHVVVLGSAFWRNPNVQELSVDTKSNRAKIATIA